MREAPDHTKVGVAHNALNTICHEIQVFPGVEPLTSLEYLNVQSCENIQSI